MTPTYIPEPAIPQIACPMIRASIDNTAPQIVEPSSKSTTHSI
jgi:hypothetical protein